MDLLSEYLEFRNIKFLRIDGSTSSEERIESLEKFDQENIDVFLLSTRACGLGLNLYKADTVILFDSDWNPQQDLQAMARAHRIGQKNEVRVFRLLAENTVEIQMYERVIQKLDLEKKAIECGNFNFSMSQLEKKEFLQNILKERINQDNKIYHSKKEKEKLNNLFSRNEDELKMFNQMDLDNEKKKKKNNGEWVFIDLDEEIKLPDWLEEKDEKEDEPTPLPAKRTRKKRFEDQSKLMQELDDMIDGKDKNDDDEYNPKNDKKKTKKKGNAKKKRKLKDVDNVEMEQKNKKRKLQGK